MDTVNTLHSLHCNKTYGYSRSEIEAFSRLIFHINTIPGAKEAFSSMHLLFWESRYLLAETRNGIIKKDGIIYNVVFHHTSSRGSILRSPKGTQYAISFRVPNPEIGLPPIALVKRSI